MLNIVIPTVSLVLSMELEMSLYAHRFLTCTVVLKAAAALPLTTFNKICHLKWCSSGHSYVQTTGMYRGV